jgi:hypothetical protein
MAMAHIMPTHLRAVLPHCIPSLHIVRAQAGLAIISDICDYAKSSAGLSNADCVRRLGTLHCQLRGDDNPTSIIPAIALMPGAGALADDGMHDRYFRISRVAGNEGVTFLCSVLMAGLLFHAEMDSSYAAEDASRFAPVGLGLAAILSWIADARIAIVEHREVGSATRMMDIDPMRRWVLGHQVFAILTQGIAFALQDFEAADRESRLWHAGMALGLAADLLIASGTAFRFTADFQASDYRDVVRPSMMAEHVGEGFSGLLSIDHRLLVAMFGRLRPAMGEIAKHYPAAHERLAMALNYVYENHKYVCAQFDGTAKPSLRCPKSKALPGVVQLEQFQRARMALLLPQMGSELSPHP